MTTEKMELRYLSSTSVLILAVLVNETSSFSFEQALLGITSKATKKMSSSPLHCINECLRRACCTEVGYTEINVGVKSYSCMIKCNNSTQMVDPGKCESRLVLIHKIPTVLAGACQDHSCKWKELCVGKRTGGYRCMRSYGK